MSLSPRLILPLLALLGARMAKAQPMSGRPAAGVVMNISVATLEETLELMVADSRVVAHVSIESGNGDEIAVRVIDVIKGDVAPDALIRIEKKPVIHHGRFAPPRLGRVARCIR
jgi:glycine/serine hydroxymethyltransferase